MLLHLVVGRDCPALTNARMINLLPFLPILILLLFAVALLVIKVIRPKFGYMWLVAALGALAAWPVQLISRLAIPSEITLVVWQPRFYFSQSPALLLDNISWPFALALVSLVLAVILTDVARAAESDWLTWTSILSITALGLAAVLAANPLTLLLAWAALDLAEVLILLSETLKSGIREQILITFAARWAGIFALLIATIISSADGQTLSYATISTSVSPYLLLAAGLRLGVLPLHPPFFEELPLRRSLGTMLNIIPAATGLMLLARTATAGAPQNLSPYLLVFTGLAAIYAGISWLAATDELDGRSFWILGLAALALASAIRAQPSATLAWGITALLSGGVIFFMSARHRLLYPIAGLGLLGLLGLPYFPSWQSVDLYKAPAGPILLLFWIAQIMIAIGYIRHLFGPGDRLVGVERWVWVIYPWGLAVLPLTHILLTVWDLRRPGSEKPDLLLFWPNLVAIMVIAISIFLYRRGFRFPTRLFHAFRQALSLRWLYRFVWQIYRLGARTIAFINLILEGEGGLLWTLLLLVILLSLLAQQQAGG